MTDIVDKLNTHAREADRVWGKGYGYFSAVIDRHHLKVGAEIGVAFGGHAETMLSKTSVTRLYGIDPYQYRKNYDDPMNLPQVEFDQLYIFTLKRLSNFGDRYVHIRKYSENALNDINGEVDFVYIDADHSYEGVRSDLCTWFKKVRVGGIVGGHDYGHGSFPGVKQAVDEFMRRFGWEVHLEGEGVWWTEKKLCNVSYFMPAFNCVNTIQNSVESIFDANIREGDELVIVNDGSTDTTRDVLATLRSKYPSIVIFEHKFNKGGSSARNTAIENAKHNLLFCLDADNILAHSSVPKLLNHMIDSGADAAAFQELRYFTESNDHITHTWNFKPGITTLADCLAGSVVPIASGNYLFTRESWMRAGRYPEFAGALDAWGFGFRQLATGSKLTVMTDSYYYHRHGHESYWVRESKKGSLSLIALQILIPFLRLLSEADVEYVMSGKGRHTWFERLDQRPLRLAAGSIGKTGEIVNARGKLVGRDSIIDRLQRKIGEFLRKGRLV